MDWTDGCSDRLCLQAGLMGCGLMAGLMAELMAV